MLLLGLINLYIWHTVNEWQRHVSHLMIFYFDVDDMT